MLGAMVRGCSGSPLVDRSAILFSLMSATVHCRVWFEYVQSDSNWSDGASRLLGNDSWAIAHGFEVVAASLPDWPWTIPISDFLSRVSDFFREALAE